MFVYGPENLAVALVRWNSPSPLTTVVAKLSFELDGGSIALRSEPPELRDDVPGASGCFSDLVPRKQGAEAILTGHARAASPASRIEVAFSVAEVDKRIWAMGNQPSRVIPLSPAYLRTAQGEPASLGPRYEPPASWAERTHAESGFEAFSCVPLDQRNPRPFLAGDRFALSGVGIELDAQLPEVRPWVICRDDEGLREVELICDTVWVDADRARLDMVWRGHVRGQELEVDWFADVAASAPPAAEVVSRWGLASAPASDATAEFSVRDVVPGSLPFGTPGPTTRTEREIGAPPASDPGGTAELDLSRLGTAGLPFAAETNATDQTASESAPSAPRSDASATAELDLSTLGQAVSLPFRGRTHAPGPTELPQAPDSGATLEMQSASPEQVSFALRHRAPPPPVPAGLEERSSGPEAAPPSAPPSVPPVRRVSRLPVEQHARVAAARLDGASLDVALRGADVDEVTWRRSERAYCIAMARDEDGALARELEAAIRAQREVRRQVSRPGDETDFDAYVTARVELEEAEDPAAVLRELGLDEPSWQRLRRQWTRRALANAELRERLEQALAAARQSLRRLSG